MEQRNRGWKPGRLTARVGGIAILCGTLVDPSPAAACGCFAPPDPSVPLIQAGERILFAHRDGEVTAHIQIQYSGKPGDFGWLLPLPAIPKKRNGEPGIDVGVDELFTQLINTTQPKYRLRRIYEECGGGTTQRGEAAGAFGGGTADAAPPQAEGPKDSPLVVQDTVGPYDFAILKADNKDEMFKWLRDNRYFVPAGTDAASVPYIRPGAFFLALKLSAGQSAGDLQPVVLRYRSDLPMIPIVLTSVGATPNMGVQVWMLGSGRAIPRNYYHTVINDAQIDWFTAGRNYNDVIIKAVGESEGRHSFVTEYAGTSGVMRDQLDRVGRFSGLSKLPTLSDPVQFVEAVLSGGFSLNGQLTSLLGQHIPLPAALARDGITPAQFFQQLGRFLGQDRLRNPDRYKDIEDRLRAFDPVKVTEELRTRIAEPTLAAGALFREFPYLTRLYTTLSPEDMNKDPVFSYNPGLPDYPNVHEATLTYHCSSVFFSQGRYGSATLATPDGWRIRYTVEEANRGLFRPQELPYSLRIETLREVGVPEVVQDNTGLIRGSLGSGCSVSARGLAGARGLGGADLGVAGLALASGALVLLRRRRRPQA